ncbi:MAG TPA: alkaline phosphatase, partial [Synergistales bacterium]|nr:alkaline phosphatase [Synergistales bacterium]
MKRSLWNKIGLTLLALLVLAGAACAAGVNNDWGGAKAKYVFMFIGDGMGLQQVNAAEVYNGSIDRTGGEPAIKKLALSGLPVQGMITTYSTNSFITDSAPAATSLASGYKTDNGVIGMDPAKKQKFTTVAQMVRAKGMKVGVLSSVSLNHATPASFYASVPSRNDYYGIGEQLLDSGFDYFAGGGIHQSTGKEKDRKDLYEVAKEKGYQVLRTREEILAAKPGTKVIAVNPVLDGSNAMPYDMDRTPEQLSLAEFTKKGIELLDNPNGFFMMVEGGKIDWACHANDAAATILDTFAFDAAVMEALSFAEKHPDETLIVVVGDHETGGMSIGFAGTQYETFFEKIAHQKESYESFDKKIAAFRKGEEKTFEKMAPMIEESFGLRTATAEERAALEEKAKAGDDAA